MTAPSTGRLADRHTRRCEAVTKKGAQCQAYAVRDSDPPRCLVHSLDTQQVAERMRKAAKANALKRRTRSEIAEHRPLSGFRDGVTLQDVIDTCRPALTATFEHDGSPDWGARLLACLVLVQTFPRDLRATPNDVRRALDDALPAGIHATLADPDPLDLYRNGRREWIEKRMRYSRITGLYVEEIPSLLVGPGENRAQIIRAEVPDMSGWEVKEFTTGNAVQVTKPDGTTVLVQLDAA
jgi:hypothetical protein